MPRVKDIYIPKSVNSRLTSNVRQNRRSTIYKMSAKQNNGSVPCFVCGKHVKIEDATLEHIKPQSKGGTDEMNNLAISHFRCNQKKGSN